MARNLGLESGSKVLGENLPHRRQSVWDLLWRLPKDEVPFAVTEVSCMLGCRRREVENAGGALGHTHCGSGFCGNRLSVLNGDVMLKDSGFEMLTLCTFDELPLFKADVVKSQLTFKVA